MVGPLPREDLTQGKALALPSICGRPTVLVWPSGRSINGPESRKSIRSFFNTGTKELLRGKVGQKPAEYTVVDGPSNVPETRCEIEGQWFGCQVKYPWLAKTGSSVPVACYDTS